MFDKETVVFLSCEVYSSLDAGHSSLPVARGVNFSVAGSTPGWIYDAVEDGSTIL